MASPAEPIGPHEAEIEDDGDGQMPNLVYVESDAETDDEEEETEEGGDWQVPDFADEETEDETDEEDEEDEDEDVDEDEDDDEGEDEAPEQRGKKKRRERQYSTADVKRGLRMILAALATGQGPTGGESVAKSMQLPSMASTLKRRKRAMLAAASTYPERAAWIEALAEPKKGVKAASRRMLSEVEEGLVAAACDHAASGGFPITKPLLRELMSSIVQRDQLVDPFNGQLFRVSKSHVKNFMKKHNIRCRKTSPVADERAKQATPAAAADLTLALEALLESPNGPAAPDLASVTLVCRALQAYWVPPPAGCKGATICGACAQRAIAARDAQERAERRVLRANHKEYAPGASGFQRAAERFTSLAGPASPTPLALPPVAASPLAPLPLAPAPAAPPLRIDELPEALLSDILLEAARSDPHLPARLDVFFVASRVCKPWQTLMATEAPRLRATLLRERGYVVVPGAGLRPAARARAHRVGDYARLSGVALQPQQNAVVLRRFVRLDEAVEQQELNPGPLSEQRRVEVVQLRGDVLEAGGRALQGVQLAGAPIHATSLLVARAGAKQQRWHTDADAQDQTFSMLFPVDDRQFCIRGLDKPLKLEPGHVLVFAGGLCHAGAERPRGAGDGLCMHAYAGSGITEKILENVFECKKSEGETD